MGTCDQAIKKDLGGRPDAALSQEHEKNDKTADSDERITNLL